MKKIFYSFVLCSLVLFFSSCGGIQMSVGSSAKYPNRVQSEWKSDFALAEKSFEQKDYKKSEKLYQSYLQRYPYNELSDKSEFRLGQIAMLDQDYTKAINLYEALVRKTPSPEIKAKSNVKLGISYYRQKNYVKTLSALDAVDVKQLDNRELVKWGSFWINASENQKEELGKRAYPLGVLFEIYNPLTEQEMVTQFGRDIVAKSKVKKDFKDWVESQTPRAQIDKRLIQYKGKALEPYLDYKLGASYYQEGNQAQAEKYLKRFLSKNPNHELAPQATKLLGGVAPAPVSVASSGSGNTNNSKVIKVGVLLPLSGKFEQYGNNTLKGIQCAASATPACKGVKNIQLVVKDTAGDPQKAAALLDELVNQEKVVAVIGPLVSAEVESVAKQAETKNVALMSLSQKKDAPHYGSTLLQFSLTQSTQVKTLLSYAQSKKVKSIGVFYPNTSYGQELLAEMQKQAPQFGIKISSKQSFNSSKADITEELRLLKNSSSQIKNNGQAFDAIFIPDSYASVAKVAALTSKLGLENTILFGTNAWNDPSLPSKMGNVKNAFFADVYFRNSTQAKTQDFAKEFQTAYDYLPSTLEAMGFDALKIISEVFALKNISKREEAKEALISMHSFYGVTGLKGFYGDRSAEVNPIIIGVDASGFKELK